MPLILHESIAGNHAHSHIYLGQFLEKNKREPAETLHTNNNNNPSSKLNQGPCSYEVTVLATMPSWCPNINHIYKMDLLGGVLCASLRKCLNRPSQNELSYTEREAKFMEGSAVRQAWLSDSCADACPVRKHHYSAWVIHHMEEWRNFTLIYTSWGLLLREYCGWLRISLLSLQWMFSNSFGYVPKEYI